MLAGLAAVGTATLVTYWRLPPEETYRVSVEGAAGGFGRTLVFLNFPAALIAIGVLALVADRLLDRRPGLYAPLCLAALALCLVVAAPGVVEEFDLDAEPVNAVPALGVLLVVVLALAERIGGRGGARARARGDRLRLVLAVGLVVLAIPWIFAETGFYAPAPFLADEPSPHEDLAAVHLGRHHGTDGVLLALAALALSRRLDDVRRGWLAWLGAAWLALMLLYGMANAVEDGWHEQVVKRGWADVRPPSMLRPAATLAWAALAAGAVALVAVWFRPGYREERSVSQSSHSDMGT